MIYKSRTHAGRVLAEKLKSYQDENCVVLGLPNGGIPVGCEIARILNVPFDLLFVSKITPRFNTEVGYGSVSESGTVNLNENLVARFGISRDEMEDDIAKTKRKIAGRVNFYRLKERHEVTGKTVILVDDGIASGYTMINAVQTVRERGARGAVIAVPTSPKSSYDRIRTMVEYFICPDIRDVFSFAVADAYDRWYDIDNEEGREILMEYGYAA